MHFRNPFQHMIDRPLPFLNDKYGLKYPAIPCPIKLLILITFRKIVYRKLVFDRSANTGPRYKIGRAFSRFMCLINRHPIQRQGISMLYIQKPVDTILTCQQIILRRYFFLPDQSSTKRFDKLRIYPSFEARKQN